MRELLDILTAADELFQRGETATLATVVSVEGSSYRMPGARMLIDSSGRRIGAISGGCLEADVARRGRLLTASDPHALVRYDGSDEDVAWGFGLGCNGSIQIFIERLDQFPASLQFIRRCFEQRINGVMATVFSADGNLAVHPGDRLMMTADSTKRLGIAQDEFSMHLDAARCLATGESTTTTYQTPDGCIQVLIEFVRPPLPLVIFGAGPDAIPLVKAAKSLGWHVTLWDRRAGYARPDRFPQADVVTTGDPRTIPISSDTAAVVMTHHYPDDRALLPLLLNSPARYIGMLGPRSRTDRILATISPRDSQSNLDRLHAPIGLDLGAEGSDQVALAIVAEILAALNDRPGTPLRDRAGPIHDPAKVRIISTGNSAQPVKAEL
jgi:xanthine/CO dehydrogenase XdhC/CoxF family maturation factor